MQHEVTSSFSSLLVGKVVVTDTSSLLIAGTGLLSKIESCTLVIPDVVVTELEDKRTAPIIGYLARQWINLIEELRLSYGRQLVHGVKVPGYKDVLLRVEPNHSTQKSLPEHMQNQSNDSTVLAVAVNMDKDVDIKGDVVLLSNDTPMRVKATLNLNIDAYEFSSSLFDNDRTYTGRTSVTLTPEEYVDLGLTNGDYTMLAGSLADRLSKPAGYHTIVDVFMENSPTPVITLRLENGELRKLDRKLKASHIVGRTLEQDVLLEYLGRPAKDLPVVSAIGSAGTGKTLLALATGLDMVKNRQYQKIVVFRSLHEMGQGQEMGFLPGDVADKMGPWGGAIGDALDVIAEKRKPPKKNEGPAAIEDRKKVAEKLAEVIEVSPITYLRGRSLANSYIMLDEAQNFSRTELLNIIARVGEGSKLVILSDPYQVDNRFLQSGSKADIWSVIRGFKEEDIFAHVTLLKTERSRLAELASSMLVNDH